MTRELAKEFEELVKQILEKNTFIVKGVLETDGYDFRIKLNQTRALVEVKMYRDKLPKIELLVNACKRLKRIDITDQEAKHLLIVSSYVIPRLKDQIKAEYRVIVWDIKDLFGLAFDFSEQYYKLENILTNAFNESLGDLLIVDENERKNIISSFEANDTESDVRLLEGINEVDGSGGSALISEKAPFVRSNSLCDDLKGITKGRKQAANFENKCVEILKYLFDNNTDLALFKEQKLTDGKLHRYDLLCRVIASNGSGFWAELAHDFHTRYVVFEFKNYTKEISQEQIFTTEKYLFQSALRSVCFMITREGADKNALIVAKGALRETGKLIVILTMQDLCGMIKLKENGDDPTDVLRDKVDDMLITIIR